MQGQVIETAGQAGGGMMFSPLEFALLSLVFTVVGGIIVGIVVRYLSVNRFMTREECDAKHTHDCRSNREIHQKIDEQHRQQVQFQVDVNKKIHTIFRMVRGMVVYSEMSPEKKEKVLNERGHEVG